MGRVLGQSPVMRRLYPLVERLAASDIPLAIEGDTGTGEISASARSSACFVSPGPATPGEPQPIVKPIVPAAPTAGSD